jgi:hypothetical protein
MHLLYWFLGLALYVAFYCWCNEVSPKAALRQILPNVRFPFFTGLLFT